MKNIAFGYVRVSGKGQIDGDGPERQSDAIKAFCQQFGVKLLEPIFFEPAVSGTVSAMDRPAFAQMVSYIEANSTLQVDCIVVERLDRLARDLMVSELLLAECRKRKIAVYAADQGALIDLASNELDPTRKLVRQILGALAEWEKSALVKKLRVARDRARRENGHCEGPKKFGSTESEATVLAQLKAMQIGGQTLREIAQNANQMGLKSRSGQPWTKASVFNVLQ